MRPFSDLLGSGQESPSARQRLLAVVVPTVMNAGRQKSLSKHFLVLLSFSAAPEAACQQTYDEKEENRGEEVHNRLFLWVFVFLFFLSNF